MLCTLIILFPEILGDASYYCLIIVSQFMIIPRYHGHPAINESHLSMLNIPRRLHVSCPWHNINVILLDINHFNKDKLETMHSPSLYILLFICQAYKYRHSTVSRKLGKFVKAQQANIGNPLKCQMQHYYVSPLQDSIM